tara:strand:- start:263 stop:424 length:162 start_codon:yes stop_codon:yes gene_type:complete
METHEYVGRPMLHNRMMYMQMASGYLLMVIQIHMGLVQLDPVAMKQMYIVMES